MRISVWHGRVLFLILLMNAIVEAQPRGYFAVGKITVSPGGKGHGYLDIAARSGDEGTRVPVTVIHGAKPGPVLGLVAGTHGYEYSPIIAMQRIHEKIDAKQLAGTVIIVHVANMPSFHGRTIYYSPVDGKNLNRVYPGRADGSLSERIADAITREVIDKSDYVVDLHCGDGNEALRPYLYWMTSGTAEVNEKSKQMAIAFGLDHIVIDNERSPDPQKSVYTSNTAITRGKPSITTETGGMGRVDGNGADLAEAGVFNLLRHYKMLPGAPKLPKKVVWMDKNVVMRSPADGLLHAKVQPGQMVAQGAVISVLTDYFGKVLHEFRAEFAGEVLYVVATPPVKKDEPVGMIGRVQR